YALGSGFFQFHGNDDLTVEQGTVAINHALAQYLALNPGDEVTIRLKDIDPVPANAPFAPSKNYDASKVLKVGQILSPEQSGNFSLGISQIPPMNIFISFEDLEPEEGGRRKANRLLVRNTRSLSLTDYYNLLSELLTPSDLGFTIRISEKTSEPELISDRIFIDSAVVQDILQTIPASYPVLTYLVNNIESSGKSTPYSFVAALPRALSSDIADNGIYISKWLSNDIGANKDDTLNLTWYIPRPGRLLEEESRQFVVSDIYDNGSRYSDPSLMPDFPGISGSAKCSGWDAGVPLLMDRIRDKDEEYWNLYRGTPKAIITYEAGKEYWGNVFGTATALRFPGTMDPQEISDRLQGTFSPEETGFTVTNAREAGNKAAGEGVDFGTLFLSLGIFIVISCIILLSLAISMFFDSRKSQVVTYHALGFRNSFIKKLLFIETSALSLAGAVPGVFLGYAVNILIIKALNSVWSGAVQTDTLSPDFSFLPLLYGLLVTIFITSVLILYKVNSFLDRKQKVTEGESLKHSPRKNLYFLLLSVFMASAAILLSMMIRDYSTVLSFAGGSLIFLSLVLASRQYYIAETFIPGINKHLRYSYSKQFYAFHPSHIITPVIFIAAGIFAIIITGANRQVLSSRMLLPAGGTGGYLLWAESAIPVREDLNSPEGRREFGLNDNELSNLEIIQARKLPGDDASCLNLNHISAPSILGINPSSFISRGSFSFATSVRPAKGINPWTLLKTEIPDNTIYGIADQTVLQWGLKLKPGDTLIYRAENGQPLNIIICAGLKSSVFQGYLLVGEKNFEKYFPSVAGYSVFLVDGKPESSEIYRNTLSDRFSGFGISVEPAGEKLASFFRVTNTYLDVFTILGALGVILGVAGLGFILIRNFNQRKREFALMMATGYSPSRLRSFILKDHVGVLVWGIFTGVISGLVATLPSVRSGSEMPWPILLIMIVLVSIAGLAAIFLSIRTVKGSSLIVQLRRE
ncbi:MAG: FtsX-like permease family protein, partial [Bacteroidales bacterium]|nr:FtsX-like permease family protein [Bacteroidales bacterium]